MDNTGSDLSQFIIVEEVAENNFFNTKERTISLINLYKKLKPKVGSTEVRSLKRLWELVALELSKIYGINIPANKCENKWKVLDRNYKKFVDNNSKTGRGRVYFEFEEEFNLIFGNKKNIKPTILLSSDSIIKEPSPQKPDVTSPDIIPVPEFMQESPEDLPLETIQVSKSLPSPSGLQNENKVKRTSKRKASTRENSHTYKKRNEILISLKNDLKDHYQRKEKVESEKRELSRRRVEDRERRTALFAEYLQELKKSNSTSGSS